MPGLNRVLWNFQQSETVTQAGAGRGRGAGGGGGGGGGRGGAGAADTVPGFPPGFNPRPAEARTPPDSSSSPTNLAGAGRGAVVAAELEEAVVEELVRAVLVGRRPIRQVAEARWRIRPDAELRHPIPRLAVEAPRAAAVEGDEGAVAAAVEVAGPEEVVVPAAL